MVNVLFGRLPTRRSQKATRREVLNKPVVLTPLKWSEVPITFSRADQCEGPIRRTREGGGMGADKNSSRRIWKLQQDEQVFQHTSPTHYPNWSGPRSHWSATGPRNQHTTFRPENAAEHQTSSLHTHTGLTGGAHRSDRSLLVKLSNFN
jgi:hypothetical protein